MIESLLTFMGQLDPFWILAVVFFAAFIENIFPPSPSDVILIVGASLINHGLSGFFTVLSVSVVGSALGFIAMYSIGYVFGERILRSGRLKFIDRNLIKKADDWFDKYGYALIVANRFLPGTRSIISFFCGASELNVWKSFLYSALSALLWNALIIWLGVFLRTNVKIIDYYLSVYSNVIIAISILVVGWLIARYLLNRKNEKKSETD